ncbi:hypothetical protein CLCR_03755 [Cladophialophora carrionii]|uniref:Uncharacterized protein n=1 Tax=Cladophialophora carrionii TaxID=86049 RepID=A0A1C1CH46_9EURO|nr:hypothetical protein CLCR_03755 [Cladophialophora carrionii]
MHEISSPNSEQMRYDLAAAEMKEHKRSEALLDTGQTGYAAACKQKQASKRAKEVEIPYAVHRLGWPNPVPRHGAEASATANQATTRVDIKWHLQGSQVKLARVERNANTDTIPSTMHGTLHARTS